MSSKQNNKNNSIAESKPLEITESYVSDMNAREIPCISLKNIAEELTNKDMHLISKLNHVKQLEIFNMWGLDMDVFGRFRNFQVERLHLDGWNVLQDTTDILSTMDKLTHLSIVGADLSSKMAEESVIHISEIPNLTSLKLELCRVVSFRAFANTKLKQLSVKGIYYETFQDSHIEEISSIKTLEKLILDCYHVTDAGISHLVSLGNLKKLTLVNCRYLTFASLAAISSMETLVKVKIYGFTAEETPIRDAPFMELCY